MSYNMLDMELDYEDQIKYLESEVKRLPEVTLQMLKSLHLKNKKIKLHCILMYRGMLQKYVLRSSRVLGERIKLALARSKQITFVVLILSFHTIID